MINSIDNQEISMKVADVLRTLMAHRSVDLSIGDHQHIWMTVAEVVKTYENNSQIHNKQINPATGVAEVVDEQEVATNE
jgi:hypothetical protein